MMQANPSALRFQDAHKLVTFMIAGLGLVALGIGDILSPLFKIFLFVAFIASWFVPRTWIRSTLYQKSWVGGLIALFAVQVLRGLSGQSLLMVTVEFSALLQISRLFNRRGAKEAQQVAVLAFLHLIAATVLTTSISYALVFAGFVFISPWMLSLSHLRAEVEAHYPDAEKHETDLLSSLDRTGVVSPRFLVGTAAMALPILIATGLFFFAFPRVGLGLFSFGYGKKQRVAGFGGEVDLGEFGAIRNDPTIVVRVFPGPKVQGIRAELLRLRGTSFDNYDGRRWRRTIQNTARAPHRSELYPIIGFPGSDALSLRLEIEPIEENVLFIPQNTVALRIAPQIRHGIEIYRQILRGSGLEFRYLNRQENVVRYEALVSPLLDVVDIEYLEEAERWKYLQVPEGHERLVAFAKELNKTHSSAQEKSKAIKEYLQDSRNFTYVAGAEQDPGDKPLEYFLFESHRGHCEYFAAALAIMLRAVNVPTRYVTGFLGGRRNDYGNYIAVRQGDAHSWVEAYIDNKGWILLDPTPAARGSVQVESGMMAQFRAMTDALRARWANHIVAYDMRKQLRLWDQLRQALHKLSKKETTQAPPGVQPKQVKHGTPSYGWLWLVLLVALMNTGFGWFLWKRQSRSKQSSLGQQRSGILFYQKIDKWLKEQGNPRPAHRTPSEHALYLQSIGFARAETVCKLTERYLLARYEGQSLSLQEQKGLLRTLDP
ncbi:MAG: DUF3488 domain-containing protein [Myxococcales bacterium]|nr:MAG: DUF3488 domain-containing protein [Myxococcales bacterium]